MALPFDPQQDKQFEELARKLAPGMKRKRVSRAVRDGLESLFDPEKYLFEEEVEEEFDDEIFLRDFLHSLAAPGPSFDLPLADLGSGIVDIDALISGGTMRGTFSRASTAMTVLSNGLLGSVASGQPRAYYDPSSFVTNLCLQSEDFTTTWTASGPLGAIAANAAMAPDGTITADLLTAGAGGSSSRSQQISMSPAIHTFSCWFRAGTAARVDFGIYEGAFVPVTATILSGPGSVAVASNICSLTGLTTEWTRVAITTVSALAGGADFLFIYPGGVPSNTGSVFAWGAQLENAAAAGEYVATTSAPASGHGTYLGYLPEGARTNLCLLSDALDNVNWGKTRTSVSANAAGSPDGTANADTLIEDATAAASHLIATPNWTSTLAGYTFSIWAKPAGRTKIQLGISSTHMPGTGANARFTLTGDGTAESLNNTDAVSIQKWPNGWYRCSMAFTPTAAAAAASFVYLLDASGSSSYNGDNASGVHLYGSQVELGSFASSYIPTVGASATRAADVLTDPTTGWLNASAGTIYLEGQVASLAATMPVLAISDGTTSERYEIDLTVTPDIQWLAVDGGAVQGLLNFGTPAANSPLKFIGVYALNDFAAALNGVLSGADTSGTLPTVNTLRIGQNGDASVNSFGTIRRVTYWPYRMSNAQLQSLTA